MTQTQLHPEPTRTALPARLPPGPRGHLLLGSARDLQRRPLEFLSALARDYGDVAQCRYVVWPMVLVNHPDYIKQVLQERSRSYNKDVIDYRLLRRIAGNGLLVNDGASWLHQRRLMQPAFHHRRIEGFGALMTTATLEMLERWEQRAAPDEPLDAAVEMMRLTLRIVGKALFSVDTSAEGDEFGQAFSVVNAYLMKIFYQPLLLLPFVPARGRRQFQRAQARLDAIVDQIIQQRRKQPAAHDDLLAMLLEARDEETGEGMDDRQLHAEVATLLIAGHETTAVALSWAWSLLSEHADVERRLHEELDRVLGGRIPTINDLPNLPYSRMVLEETLRLYPPAWSFSRNAAEDDEIGGYRVPKGTVVLVSPYTMHRHPAFWERPEAFDPERFTPERSAGRPRFAYFPFGGGPRQCIGNQFAMLEAQLVLATVAQRCRLRVVPGHPVEPEPLITLRLKHGLLVTLEPR
jgi:cytochrome P450